MDFKVEFIKDFATKLKGDTADLDSQLASQLIVRKIAKLYVEKKKKVTKSKK